MPTEELFNSFQGSLDKIESGVVAISTPTWGGGESTIEIDVSAEAAPALFIVQIVGVSSFLGDYGVGKTVKTFTLLPGESTTISTRTWRATEESVALGSSIIDSFDESSADSFSNSVQSETTDTSTKSKTENWQAEAEAKASWGWGSASVSGGASGEYSSSTEEFAKAVDDTVETHAAEASSHRENSVTSSSESTTSSEDETVVERTIKNINVRRVLNFVFRELNQSYTVKTHLRDVRIAFSNGQSGSWREVPLSGLRAILEEFIDGTKVDEIAGNILRTIATVFDYEDNPVQILEKVTVKITATGIDWDAQIAVPDASGEYPAPPSDGSFFYRFRRGVLGQEGDENQVPGVLLKQREVTLKTDSLVVDSLLGANESLDEYSKGLQEAAVLEKQLANQREKLAQDIVASKDATMAELYASLFNVTTDDDTDDTAT